MIIVHAAGTLTRQPETKLSSKGVPYTHATMLVGSGDNPAVVNITAFAEIGTTLAGLVKGDGISITGSARLSAYTDKRTEEPRASLSVTASRIISLVDVEAAKTPRKPATKRVPPSAQAAPMQQYATRAAQAPAPAGFEFIDEQIPF